MEKTYPITDLRTLNGLSKRYHLKINKKNRCISGRISKEKMNKLKEADYIIKNNPYDHIVTHKYLFRKLHQRSKPRKRKIKSSSFWF